MIHCNLKHLVISGQRIGARFLNEVQQFTGLETLILPANPYWNSPDGVEAFNTRIAQRLSLKWTQWRADDITPAFPLVPGDMSTDSRGRSCYGRTAHALPYLASVPTYTHHLDPILGDATDYSRINYGTVVTFAKEEELYGMLAGRVVVMNPIDPTCRRY
jgi:hypothetical protein